jgi:hypothetical protein
MGDYHWMDSVKKIINSLSLGYSETKIPLVDPYTIPEIRINHTYPYTFEQTVKVTHYSKPRRRDPSRNWRKK